MLFIYLKGQETEIEEGERERKRKSKKEREIECETFFLSAGLFFKYLQQSGLDQAREPITQFVFSTLLFLFESFWSFGKNRHSVIESSANWPAIISRCNWEITFHSHWPVIGFSTLCLSGWRLPSVLCHMGLSRRHLTIQQQSRQILTVKHPQKR